jgi:DNA-binding beta-propeller fold protein YncE
MSGRSSRLTILATVLLSAPLAFGQQRGGQELFGPYEPVLDWPKPLPDGPDGVKHDGWTWGAVASVYAESPDRIWIAMRGELPLPEGASPWTPYGLLDPPRRATGSDDGRNARCEPEEARGWERRYHHLIFVLDGEGNLVQDWTRHDKLFDAPCGRGPNTVRMSPYDPDKHVWVVDDGLNVIHKFTYDGELVMTLGTKGERGRDAGRLFDGPTDIAWLPDGTFFISDGYGGTRVAKFDKDGNFLLEWGSAPVDPDNLNTVEFNGVLGLVTTDDGRVVVADGGHGRVQLFRGRDGRWRDMFRTGPRKPATDHPLGTAVSRPHALLITAEQELWVGDAATNRIVKYDLFGYYKYSWGGPGKYPGQFGGIQALAVDQDGNLYVAEGSNGRVQKLRPKWGADPSKVVGQEVRFTASDN